MIVKSWQFRGYEWSQDMPEVVKPECSKRAGSPHLWVHTQAGEEAAASGQYIAINLRGHVQHTQHKARRLDERNYCRRCLRNHCRNCRHRNALPLINRN